MTKKKTKKQDRVDNIVRLDEEERKEARIRKRYKSKEKDGTKKKTRKARERQVRAVAGSEHRY